MAKTLSDEERTRIELEVAEEAEEVGSPKKKTPPRYVTFVTEAVGATEPAKPAPAPEPEGWAGYWGIVRKVAGAAAIWGVVMLLRETTMYGAKQFNRPRAPPPPQMLEDGPDPVPLMEHDLPPDFSLWGRVDSGRHS